MRARFGPAGNGDLFYEKGYKSSKQVPEFLSSIGLDAFEYQCGRGVNIGEKTASEIGENAKLYDIALSIHAPYYISLASSKPEVRENSIRYILESAQAAKYMSATRVIVHPGGMGGLDEGQALELASDTLKRAIRELDRQNLGDIRLCPETMGKASLLGSLEQILQLCLLDERLIPCVDFGHLNARNMGALAEFEDYKAVFDKIEDVLGISRLREMHIHFSKIEFTKGGERRHLTFEDTVYGPSFEPVIEMILRKNAFPVVICESAGTQAEDARSMKTYYDSCRLKTHKSKGN